MNKLVILEDILLDGPVNTEENKESVEEWAEKILNDNKELLEKTSREEFLNYVIYGK